MAERAIFLDRDGVVNVRQIDHVKSWSEFQFMPDALVAMRELAVMGERTVVITNQSVVGRGLVPVEELALIHTKMEHAVSAVGGQINRVYACLHTAESGCGCRKPRIGLLLQAKDELGIALQDSVLVGDSGSDIEAARAAGCQPIFIGDAEQGRLFGDVPVARNLLHAVTLIRHFV